MPDLTTISAFLGSIKTATEIAKAIKGAGLSLEKAELKLKIAELTESLAEIRIKAVEIQELIHEKDQRIKELEHNLENTVLIRHRGMYYEPDEHGKPRGDPYCSPCWETKSKSVHMSNMGGIHICPICGDVIDN